MTFLGRCAFFLLWPLIWFYAPLTRRVRVLVRTPDGIIVVRNLLGPGLWQLPGGGIRFGETVEMAGVREIKEELSLTVEHVTVFNQDPVICRQWGLLFRLHYAFVEINQVPKKHSRAITAVGFMNSVEPNSIAHEVRQAIKHADRYDPQLLQ